MTTLDEQRKPPREPLRGFTEVFLAGQHLDEVMANTGHRDRHIAIFIYKLFFDLDTQTRAEVLQDVIKTVRASLS